MSTTVVDHLSTIIVDSKCTCELIVERSRCQHADFGVTQCNIATVRAVIRSADDA